MKCQIQECLTALVLAAGCATAAPSNVKVEFATQEEGLCTIIESPRLVQITCGSRGDSPEGVRHLRRYSFEPGKDGMPLSAKREGYFGVVGISSSWTRCDIPEGVPLCSEVLNVYRAEKTYLSPEVIALEWRE